MHRLFDTRIFNIFFIAFCLTSFSSQAEKYSIEGKINTLSNFTSSHDNKSLRYYTNVTMDKPHISSCHILYITPSDTVAQSMLLISKTENIRIRVHYLSHVKPTWSKDACAIRTIEFISTLK